MISRHSPYEHLPTHQYHSLYTGEDPLWHAWILPDDCARLRATMAEAVLRIRTSPSGRTQSAPNLAAPLCSAWTLSAQRPPHTTTAMTTITTTAMNMLRSRSLGMTGRRRRLASSRDFLPHATAGRRGAGLAHPHPRTPGRDASGSHPPVRCRGPGASAPGTRRPNRSILPPRHS